MIHERNAGILLHITSLPSAFGIGDLGPESYAFADFLVEAKQRYWQILPLSPIEVSSGNSPYSGLSAFAGNILLISPELLLLDGLLTDNDLKTDIKFNPHKTDYITAGKFKIHLLDKCWKNFQENQPADIIKGYERFKTEESYWLNDYSIYAALKTIYGESWTEWPKPIRHREKYPLEGEVKKYEPEIEREKFFQYLFFKQWFELKEYCNRKGVKIFGDMPFYVGYDSSDVWSHPDLFKLDNDLSPKVVSGVPPDYFSETGQRWGTPVFDWPYIKKHDYDWWIMRMKHNLRIYDLLRLDHFRAFSAYWEVPAEETTAINGRWEKGPSTTFFNELKRRIPELPIVAEDLGDIDQPVYDLIDQYNLPGMKVLQFAFGDNPGENLYAPHNHIKNCVVYTGTHDNNTVNGWFNQASTKEKRNLAQYTGRKIGKDRAHEAMIQLALCSVANTAIIPMQDYLGLGSEGMMNTPGVPEGNWEWRMQTGQANLIQAKQIATLTTLYGRDVKILKKDKEKEPVRQSRPSKRSKATT